MTAQEAKQRLERIWKAYTSAYDTVSIEDLMAFEMATNALGAIDQIQWERDLAIKQLHDLGYGLGEKPREETNNSNQEVKKSNQEVKKSSDKLIKASDAVDIVAKHSALYGDGEISTDDGEALLYGIMSEIMNSPSAEPEIIYCRDCINYDMARNKVNGICNHLEIPMYADDWCSRAERRTDEQTISE